MAENIDPVISIVIAFLTVTFSVFTIASAHQSNQIATSTHIGRCCVATDSVADVVAVRAIDSPDIVIILYLSDIPSFPFFSFCLVWLYCDSLFRELYSDFFWHILWVNYSFAT
jgi:hypothetical protein